MSAFLISRTAQMMAMHRINNDKKKQIFQIMTYSECVCCTG